MANKKNWTEGAGIADKKDPIWNGGPASGENGGLEPNSAPNHLSPDSTLKGYISDVQSEYQREYDQMWNDQYHGGNNYPSLGSKTKGGMD